MVTTTTEPHVTLKLPVVVTSNKVNASPQVLNTAPGGQGRNLVGKEKVLSHQIRERKMLSKHLHQVQ